MKYILLAFVLVGCYNEKKAMQQFSRAVSFDPAIPSNFCARQYPPTDTTIRDTIIVTDTTVLPGESTTDTVTVNDTVRITRTVQLPGQVVTRTVTIRDTIRVTNTAALEACRLENTKVIAVLGPTISDRDKFKKRSRTYLWILIAAGAVIGAGLYSRISKMFLPKLA